MDATETDDVSLIGEECHIVARKPDGPRGDPSYPEEKLDRYDNLIMLCSVHHKLIDDQSGTYTVRFLKAIKEQHECWVRESLKDYDPLRQRDEEIYASYAEKWIELGHINNWKAWSSYVLSGGQPGLRTDVDRSLNELREWLFSRIWPKRYTELEDAFENFRRVLQDFQNTFHEHAEEAGDMLDTKKFYRIDEWDEERYERLVRKYDFHVGFVEDLMMELTRAANYVCDKIREYVDPTFRIDEGALVVISGPYMDLSWHHHRAQYRDEERTRIPYPGLEKFKDIRMGRD